MVETNVLWNDVNRIVSNSNSGVTEVTHDLVVHTKDKDIEVLIVLDVEVKKDYNANVGDELVISFLMGAGDFYYDIHPYRDNLLISVTRNIGSDAITNKYKMVLINNNTDINGSRYDTTSREKLNQEEQLTVELQAIDPVLEILSLSTYSGIFKYSIVEDVINGVLSNSIKDLKNSGKSLSCTIDLFKPVNNRVFNQIKIPTGTKVLDIPSYLQNIDYGVYNGNIGTYVTKYKDTPTIFVYPLYNTTRALDTDKKLMVFAVTGMKYEMIENTYLVEGDTVKIVSGQNTRSMSVGDNNILNNGVGFTASDANAVMGRNLDVTNDGTTFDKDQNISGQNYKDKPDGNNKSVHIGHTSNLYRERSKVVKNSMAIYQIQWNYPDEELIYPGMPVTYIFADNNDTITKLNGIVQSFYLMYNQSTKTVTSLINIMVEQPKREEI